MEAMFSDFQSWRTVGIAIYMRYGLSSSRRVSNAETCQTARGDVEGVDDMGWRRLSMTDRIIRCIKASVAEEYN